MTYPILIKLSLFLEIQAEKTLGLQEVFTGDIFFVLVEYFCDCKPQKWEKFRNLFSSLLQFKILLKTTGIGWMLPPTNSDLANANRPFVAFV